MAVAIASPVRSDAGVPTVGRLPLLFADDSGISARSGAVRTVHAARTHDSPVLQADRPWEGDRVYIYGSAYHDPAGAGVRLWYASRPGVEVGGRSRSDGLAPALRNRGFDVTLYATSKDGLHFQKPNLGFIEFDGSKDNNIVYDLSSPSVLRDDLEADPAKRYKMLGYLVRPTHSYNAAYSADGVVWHAYPKSAVLDEGDTVTLTRSPATGEYLAFHKRPATVRGFGRRVVWLSRSRDFQDWSAPELVLAPDECDDAWASRPRERTEIYDMSVFPNATGFVGLAAIFRVMHQSPREETKPGQSPLDGPIDIQLATSVDGSKWQRSWPRIGIIPRGPPGSFDGGALLGVSSTVVDTETESWVYYTAINTGHGSPIPPKRITIGRADWRLHGFVSLDGGPGGATVQTVPLRFSGETILINANAARGELRAQLLSEDGETIPGYSFADSIAMSVDATAFAMRWKGNIHLPRDRVVRVALEFRNAELFSVTSK